MTGSQEKDRPLGVAVWGVGAHAIKTVLPAIFASPDLRLVGIHSRNRQTLAEQSALYGCHAWHNRDDLLTTNSVDVVFLATPTSLHFVHGRAVLAAGKHLWCEKPLTSHLQDAVALAKIARTNNLALAVVCGPKYHPHFDAVRAQFGPAGIGQPKHIEAVFQFPHIDRKNFRYDPDLGGGALLDLGFYLLTIANALSPGKLIGLDCKLATENGFRVDTRGSAQLRFDCGTTADLSWGYGAAYTNYLSVQGDRGHLCAGPFFSKPKNRVPSLTLIRCNEKKRRVKFANNDPFVDMFRIFAKGVWSQSVRDHLLSEALESQRFLDLAKSASYASTSDLP